MGAFIRSAYDFADRLKHAPARTRNNARIFFGTLPQIGADQRNEHGTEGKGPRPRLLGQIAQIAAGAIDEGAAQLDCGKDDNRVFGAKCLDGLLQALGLIPSQAHTKAAAAIKSRQELIPLGACLPMSGQALRTIGKGKLRCGRSCCSLYQVTLMIT